jgi:hypothetical protein
MVDKNLVIGKGFEFIDPIDIGSMIAWKIIYNDASFYQEGEPSFKNYMYKYSGGITLSDCSRSINWGVSVDREGVEKVKRAIAVLQSLHDSLIKTIIKGSKEYKDRSSKPRKMKAADIGYEIRLEPYLNDGVDTGFFTTEFKPIQEIPVLQPYSPNNST